MNAASTVRLPYALILLVHLHILEYPHANNQEYDHDMFNARTRGLRERAKIMEDIAHYMVGKLEGMRGAKTVILATYPCHQPAESLAFRTSLAKYLEGLRHQSVYAHKGDAPAAGAEPAVWWKEVVVRRSLLEECAGEKFERLMLALSTHALMRASRPLDPAMMSELLQTEPLLYTTALRRYQSVRSAWSKSASLLTQAQRDFKALRNRLEVHEGASRKTKYSSVATSRLKSSVDAAVQMLLKQHWTGDNGKRALDLVVELAGLKVSWASLSLPLTILDSSAGGSTSAPIIPSPLPVAAAHHPTHLNRLRRSVFQKKRSDQDAPLVPLRAHSEIVVTTILDTEKRMYNMLADALSRLQRRLSELEKIKSSARTQAETFYDGTSFWTVPREYTTAFNLKPQVDASLMSSLGLEADFLLLNVRADQNIIEKKIDHIRQNLLPSYPPVPDLSLPRLPPHDYNPPRSKQVKVTSSGSSRRVMESEEAQSGLPVPPALTPEKSIRNSGRKSYRVSAASTRNRASMFRVFSGQVNAEVDRLLDEAHDFSTDDEVGDDDSFTKTPKGKRKPTINRIWTAGTPASATRRAATFRHPTANMPTNLDGVPAPRIPSISLSISTSSMQSVHSDEDETMPVKDVDATPRPLIRHRSSHVSSEDFDDIFVKGSRDSEGGEGGEDTNSDILYDDPPSLTLKEILLSAEASHFDLLEIADTDMVDEVTNSDFSFEWE